MGVQLSKMVFALMLGLTINSVLASTDAPDTPDTNVPDPMKLNLVSNSAELRDQLGQKIFSYLRYVRLEKDVLRKCELELRMDMPDEKRFKVEIRKLASQLRTAIYDAQWDLNLMAMDQLESLKLPELNFVDYFWATHEPKIKAYNLLMDERLKDVCSNETAIKVAIDQLTKVYAVSDLQKKKSVLDEVRALYEKITLGQSIIPINNNNTVAVQEEKKEGAGDGKPD